MSLKDKILDDMKIAMRNKDASRLESIRLLRAAIQRQEVDTKQSLDEVQVLATVQKQIKQSQDSIALYQQGEREDLAAKEQQHIGYLQHYLPEPLSDAQIEVLLSQAINDTGATQMRDMGKVMAVLKQSTEGRADMGRLSGLIKQRLA